jgi:hypothetical protein
MVYPKTALLCKAKKSKAYSSRYGSLVNLVKSNDSDIYYTSLNGVCYRLYYKKLDESLLAKYKDRFLLVRDALGLAAMHPDSLNRSEYSSHHYYGRDRAIFVYKVEHASTNEIKQYKIKAVDKKFPSGYTF